MTEHNSLSERRKRGSGLSERTSLSLSPHAKQIIASNKINLSAWVEKKLIKEFGSTEDPILAKLFIRMERMQEENSERAEEMRILAMSINNRQAVLNPEKNLPLPPKVEESGIPPGYPDMDSREAVEAAAQLEIKEINSIVGKDPEKEFLAPTSRGNFDKAIDSFLNRKVKRQ